MFSILNGSDTQPPRIGLRRPKVPHDGSVLVLGGQPKDIPGILCHSDPRVHSTMIALAAPIDPSDLARALDMVDDPALPIADFASNRGIRHDFEADELDLRTYAEAYTHFKPIWERLDALPFRGSRNERPGLTALRLAYSRDVPIEASFAPNTKWLVDYALLGISPYNRDCLEGLVALEALRRRHFTRTSVCIHCNSARLLAFEACPDCGGSDLADERIVHHYRCGCQESESKFIRGRQLICPKCRRELRHFGVDYGKPGIIVHCRSCGASNAEPDFRFSCLDCAAVNPTDPAPHTDWYHYDITEQGLYALREGRLPILDLDEEPGARPAARSLREFKLLVSAALRNARRFDRQFSIVELVSDNMATLRKSHEPSEIESALGRAVTVVLETLSECELVAVVDGAGLLIGFPETSVTEAAAIVERVRAAIAADDTLDLNFSATMHEGEAAAELLARH
jgi:Thaumarchaeal output domain 1